MDNLLNMTIYSIECHIEVRERQRENPSTNEDMCLKRSAIWVMQFLESIGIMPEHLVNRAMNNMCRTPYYATSKRCMGFCSHIPQPVLESINLDHAADDCMRRIVQFLRLSEEHIYHKGKNE